MTTDGKNWIREKTYRLCREEWHLDSFQMTPVGLGLKVGYSACNPDTRAIWSLLDLLNLIREIALQADCLMPFVVFLPRADNNGLRRRQDLHRGRYLLLDISKSNQAGLLLNPQPVDIQLEQEKYLTLPDIRDRAEKELKPTLYNRLFKTLPVLPEKGRSQDLLHEWKEVWKKRLLRKGTEGDSVEKKGVQQAQKDFLTGLGRIKKCSITNFKGIEQLEDIDLDADIILVTGANGNGKSSFVEALSLALTGYHPDIKLDKQDKFLPGHFFHYNAEEFSIKLEMEADKEKIEKVTVAGKNIGEFSPSRLRILRYPNGTISEPVPVLEELNFRLTSYLPDHVNLLFDEKIQRKSRKTGGTSEKEESSEEESLCLGGAEEVVTVRDLFPSLPLEAEELCRAVQSELKEIDDLQKVYAIQKKGIQEQTEKGFKRAGEFFATLCDALNALLDIMNKERITLVDDWQKQEPTPEDFAEALEQQEKAQRPALGIIGAWSSDNLDKGLQYLWKKYSRSIESEEITEITRQLEDKKQELKRIKEQLEGMEDLAGDLEQLRDIFTHLGDESFCRESSALLKAMGMREVAVEVDWVDPVRSHRCAQELAAASSRLAKELRDKKEKLEKEISSLEARHNAIMEKLPVWKSKEEVSALVKRDGDLIDQLNLFTEAMTTWKENKQELENSRELEEELRELADFLEGQRADLEKFCLATEQSLNGVLKRFVMTGGLEADEVEVTPDFKLRADKVDKSRGQRNLDCLSSGQKAQLAMAWMVACRELIQNPKNSNVVSFPHRVMIMDDPSTTFDLSNLHSQAILWRQLAYNEDPSQRYQIFIVSHHEEFSSRLLDLLCPPGLKEEKKCRMKLLRFTNWTTQEGAKLEPFDVEQAPKDIERGYELFRAGLKYLVKGQE